METVNKEPYEIMILHICGNRKKKDRKKGAEHPTVGRCVTGS
jgi:hypothetical protein